MANIIILLGAVVGLIVYFVYLHAILKRAEAKGHPFRMFPVCHVADCLERHLANQRAEKDRLLALARPRPIPVVRAAIQAPLAALPVAPRAPAPFVRHSAPTPPPIGQATLMPTYYGLASLSILGAGGELFLHLASPMIDAKGRTHTEMATTVLVPPDAQQFILQAIANDRPLLVNCVPANAHDTRMRVTVEDTDGRLVTLREWILEQALAWRPLPVSAPTRFQNAGNGLRSSAHDGVPLGHRISLN